MKPLIMRQREDFQKFVKKDRYQVFLFTSPLPFPFNAWVHAWIVCNEKGKITRYEVMNFRNKIDKEKGYLQVNMFEPWKGMYVFGLLGGPKWKGKLVEVIEGDKNSTAARIGKFMRENLMKYPYKDVYHYVPGPNSNTFIQSLLNRFPDCEFKLPRNAPGKGYCGKCV